MALQKSDTEDKASCPQEPTQEQEQEQEQDDGSLMEEQASLAATGAEGDVKQRKLKVTS
jgi:hypothetical protein